MQFHDRKKYCLFACTLINRFFLTLPLTSSHLTNPIGYVLPMAIWRKNLFDELVNGTGRNIAKKEVLRSYIRSVRFPGEGRQRFSSIVPCDSIFRRLSRSW